MNTNIYPVKIRILLKPVGTPKCLIRLDDQRRDIIVDKEQWITIDFQGCGRNILEIEHYGKDESDPATALIIDQIQFNEISSPKFVYQGTYYPFYPKHLIGSAEMLHHQPYLSWNGVWQLEFTLPIYTWIHKTLDLGWIYD
jgi:hypothetical protein